MRARLYANIKKRPSGAYHFLPTNSSSETSKSDIVLQEITTRNYVDELKEYKFLLDNDIITQQEFDDKKQAILNSHNQKSV